MQLDEILRVRIAQAYTNTYDCRCIGQVYDIETLAWTDLVWVDYEATTKAVFTNFGNAEYYCRVISLNVTKDSVTRAQVRPVAYIGGGMIPNRFNTSYIGAATTGLIELYRDTTPIVTTLPALGDIQNVIKAQGIAYIGWKGPFTEPLQHLDLSFNTTYGLRTILDSYPGGLSYYAGILSPIEYKSTGLATLNSWLSSNLVPIYQTIAVYATLTVEYDGKMYSFTIECKVYYQSTTGGYTLRDGFSRLHKVTNNVNALATRTGCISTFNGLTAEKNNFWSGTPSPVPPVVSTSLSTSDVVISGPSGSATKVYRHTAETGWLVGIDVAVTCDTDGQLTNVDVQPYTQLGSITDFTIFAIDLIPCIQYNN